MAKRIPKVTSGERSGDGTVSRGISEGEVYTLSEAMRRLGVGRAGYRSAVRQGLVVIRKLGRTFISGRELVRFLTDGEAPK